jgi:predicted RNA-binding Zn ribbon-like protein
VFEYISGDISADLVNTAGAGIADYNQFLEWAEGAGAVSESTAESLRRVARARPAAAAAVLDTVRRVRGIIHDVFSAVVAGRSPDLAGLNAELAQVLSRRQVSGKQWVWVDAERELESPLWPVVLAAATLLTSPDAARLRVCAKRDCGWMFVDRSRNGLRRWCSMADCGTREKSRRRAAKQSASVARRAQ